ncbi:outer membrane protein [Croceicoccus bisphenolivorans]|uniref:outer membrane protein n=1 Tax=Croceicoccus bisphenolivorans TaxID=1783232 RepID=UPI000834FB7B|nr:hypothetical protein [Croceicoccus bisphenolivorans]
MIKNVVIAAAMATAGLAATPALAQGGARVGLELGVVDDDFLGTEDATYGVTAGYDFDLGNLVAGPVASYTATFENDGDIRDVTVGGRIGAKVGAASLFYGTIAYTNLDADGASSIDGVKYGLGLEHDFGGFYGAVETRYADYELGVETYQTVIAAGVKF